MQHIQRPIRLQYINLFRFPLNPEPCRINPEDDLSFSTFRIAKTTLPRTYPGATLNTNDLGFESTIARQRLRHFSINRTFECIIANRRTMHKLLWQASYELSFNSRNDYQSANVVNRNEAKTKREEVLLPRLSF